MKMKATTEENKQDTRGQRIEMIGGNFTVESAPAHGTTVRAEIPFNQEKTTS